jgi:hypothetical protein
MKFPRSTNRWTAARPKPVTGPQDGDIINFDLSPDGKQFAIARGRQVGDVVMITSVQ